MRRKAPAEWNGARTVYRAGGGWEDRYMTGFSTVLAERAADDVPGVKLAGIAIGVLLIIAALRGMFGRRNR